MGKRLHNLVLFSIVFLFFISCEDVEPPVADFSVSQRDVNGDISMTFTDLSNNSDKCEWTFEGGIPESSTEQNPTVIYKEPGIFDVSLVVSNDGGSDQITKTDHINIVQLKNNLNTEAEVSLDDQQDTIPANSYILMAIYDKSTSQCHIETSGKNADGEQIGMLIYWDLDIDLSLYQYYMFYLPPQLISFNITNNSNTNITHLAVNYGNPDYMSFEEINIPNDQQKHGTGYYFSNRNMEIRAYSPGGYIGWIDGEDFDIPWTNYQYIDLNFDGTIINQSFIDRDSNSSPVTSKKYEATTINRYKITKE